ncbi:MAG TPA: ATP-binding protein, partial [Anaerolineales bacterium]|nr:ATP-binding protein [Anaerolineales bacterium]
RPNGKVTLRARIKEKDKKQMQIIVKDTGYGIPAEAMPHLFKKFFRVHETENKVAGTGLGLAISKEIIQGHRGSIEVKSKSGKGTSFIIFLPLRMIGD